MEGGGREGLNGEKYTHRFRALVFVQQRMTCRVVCEYLSTLAEWQGDGDGGTEGGGGGGKCGFITGHSRADPISGFGGRKAKETLDAFLKGDIEVSRRR